MIDISEVRIGRAGNVVRLIDNISVPLHKRRQIDDQKGEEADPMEMFIVQSEFQEYYLRV